MLFVEVCEEVVQLICLVWPDGEDVVDIPEPE